MDSNLLLYCTLFYTCTKLILSEKWQTFQASLAGFLDLLIIEHKPCQYYNILIGRLPAHWTMYSIYLLFMDLTLCVMLVTCSLYVNV